MSWFRQQSSGRHDLDTTPSRSDRDQTINKVTHKFSPGGQATLYPVKLFGIMSLFEHCPELSTAAYSLYDECGDMIAQS